MRGVRLNIDNLHERAGNTNVIHMHGELLKVHAGCLYSALPAKSDRRGRLAV
ncbi:Sir2 family NAD-dependent protein deacetylase [Escherichia sp. R-CC3]